MKRPIQRWLLLVSALAVVLGRPSPADAHALDPSLLELTDEGTQVHVRWSTPVARAEPLRVVLPCDEVKGSLDESVSDDRRTWVRTWRLDCGAESPGLAGRTVAVEGLDLRTGDALVRWTDRHGRVGRAVLDAAEPSVEIPGTPTGSLAGDYVVLGVEHILLGFDHLAFVFALMLLVDGRRRLVWTLTAFTVGHSVTLAAAALDVVTPPSDWIEAAIAASILVLAVELAHRLRGGDDRHAASPASPASPESSTSGWTSRWLARRPWLVAGSFGLLHGCGFAGALREIGLPRGDIPQALLAFNVGIELGQLLFVGVLWLAALALRRLVRMARRGAEGAESGGRRLEWAATALAVYAVGTLASYWTLDRVLGLF